MKRAALVLATVLVPAWALAQTPVDQKRPAAASGKVTIENMSGSVKVTGWDRAEVQVKGTLGDGAELSFDGRRERDHDRGRGRARQPDGHQERPRGLRPRRQLGVRRGLPGHDLGGRGHRLGVGRDGERLDHPVGGGEGRRAAERQRRDRGDEGLRPPQGRGGQRHGDRARRLGRARGLDRQRQAARDRRLVRRGRPSRRSPAACGSRAGSPPRRRCRSRR